jgi:hypothetical protein
VQAVAAALKHMEATASALFVGKILKEETALKLEAGTKRIQAPPCFRHYFNQCCEQCSGSMTFGVNPDQRIHAFD